jgi:N-acetyl-anhydromuramyl-L-alanine amidase AmpD
MSYRYVQARYDSYGNRTATKALVVHMTEGSGTEADVDYLANNPLRGVSVHFVILKTGEIVQMLGWNRIAGSINPNELRTTDDPPYTSPDGARVVYGATLRDAIMGSWINGGLLAVEVGGKAVDGPNQAQSEALVRLLADVRTRYPGLPVLGHRDFTSTKGCPGHKVLWASLGGHGKPAAPEDSVQRFLVPEGPQQLATLKDGTWLYVYSDLRTDPANVQVNPGRTFPYVGKHSSTPDVRSVAYEPATADDNLSSWAMFVRREDITTISPPPAPVPQAPTPIKPVTVTVSQDGKVLNELDGAAEVNADLVRTLATYAIAVLILLGAFVLIYTAKGDPSQSWLVVGAIVGYIFRDSAGAQATANVSRINASAQPSQVVNAQPADQVIVNGPDLP